MRWVPLTLILFFTAISAINIYKKQTATLHRSFSLLGVMYLMLLEIIVFTPFSFDGSQIYLMQAGIGKVNLFQLDIFELGFFENILLTVPLGMLIKSYFSEISLSDTAIIGVFVGSWIEITQYYLSHAFLINRSSDINDVIANALGIIVGAVMVRVVINSMKRNTRIPELTVLMD
ncbi:VanZ family protein [Companilactobacillus furfuricola]|uniref:VanZ family protein n=1 Tax=Companilactobacillus furfuricola TaxID=1462575 RepID=UPI000F7A6D3C|nr:VanZ family protein [Companilactobacillus furfuricola]